MPGKLSDGDVLLGQRVNGDGWHGVGIVSCHPLQVDDVRLGIMGDVILESLVRGALGEVGLCIITTAGWKTKGDNMGLGQRHGQNPMQLIWDVLLAPLGQAKRVLEKDSEGASNRILSF